ncbi:hypothetical protein [Actinophytocola xanthii]|uniref:Uncharacterized protein n=1 Tax=Actinophytocola xanthii TaxID=1912961 RepID=A0A1Q8CLZ0_9PSEU|nr:hypothetical protein [Actinophytocola xanthii]OLF15377.1 hypothetical protein BU204_22320 [Actinophytocola xanthii]
MSPFTTPAPHGYLYVGIRVDPPRRVPLVPSSTRRAERLRACADTARRLTELAEVVDVAVYEAVLIPPAAEHPRFDVMVLVRTTSPETIAAVEDTAVFRELAADFVMPARNGRRIGDIDRSKAGAFLFNHFTAAEPERALRTWEEIAGWFTDRAGVRDSALLQPVRNGPYVFVNHVRLPGSAFGFFPRLLRPSFRRSVSRRLRENGIGFAAVACRPVPVGSR